jgi:phenylpyruvate tautomerase PptA (4-oxalocrotonate tautomerase family)
MTQAYARTRPSKEAAVPMIDLTLPADALDDDSRADLVQRLLSTLLRWEGAPEGDRSKSLAWAFVHLVDSVVVAHSPSGKPHYRVEVATPQGALDDERRAGLVAEVTDLVLAAEGTAFTPEDAFRVWVILREVAEGSWGAAGRIWRFADVIGYIVDDPELGRTVAAERLATAGNR